MCPRPHYHGFVLRPLLGGSGIGLAGGEFAQLVEVVLPGLRILTLHPEVGSLDGDPLLFGLESP